MHSVYAASQSLCQRRRLLVIGGSSGLHLFLGASLGEDELVGSATLLGCRRAGFLMMARLLRFRHMMSGNITVVGQARWVRILPHRRVVPARSHIRVLLMPAGDKLVGVDPRRVVRQCHSIESAGVLLMQRLHHHLVIALGERKTRSDLRGLELMVGFVHSSGVVSMAASALMLLPGRG